MKYRDLFTLPHGEARELKRQCLIWSENYEHASIDAERYTVNGSLCNTFTFSSVYYSAGQIFISMV